MIPEKIMGTVCSWNSARAFGTIRVGPPSSLERYFLHISQIRSGTAEPQPGMVARFVVGTNNVKPGQLQPALDVDIVVDSLQSAPTKDGGAA